MAPMESFDHILNWRLKRGSHTFPGREGGTCINEAAIVAAGFPYRPIRTVEDMPACFSRPICQLAMYLNDVADDEERQQLLPFVTRLVCADTAEVERQREIYISSHMYSFSFMYSSLYQYSYPYLRHDRSFQDGLEVLQGALAIGRQADVPALEEVSARMETVQRSVTAPMSAADHPILSKVKGWLVSVL